MKPIIKIENLSKQYRLGDIGTGTLSHDLNRWWHTMRGKEDPYLKIGEANDRANKGNSDYVWAMQDINLEVMPGEVLGIIGKNGAGKSTLLKLLSRVTAPTTGSIKTRGRMASLLEVGTGFHPELTGRENIFLNGAILGMTKKEIRIKFDEIVDFAGCERYIDTPVKRYSSGMYVRLAFAVAAHLEPEILVVDEVLAVGDAEFQKKAIGKMKDVSTNEGRTVLFVSHNMAAVKNLCTTGILLENGLIKFEGKVNDVINSYLNLNDGLISNNRFIETKTQNREVTITEATYLVDSMETTEYENGRKFEIFWTLFSNIDSEFSIEILLKDKDKIPILFSPIGLINGWKYKIKSNESMKLKTEVILPFLAAGQYYCDIMAVVSGKKFFHYAEDALNFSIPDNYLKETGWNFKQTSGQGSILLNSKLEIL